MEEVGLDVRDRIVEADHIEVWFSRSQKTKVCASFVCFVLFLFVFCSHTLLVRLRERLCTCVLAVAAVHCAKRARRCTARAAHTQRDQSDRCAAQCACRFLILHHVATSLAFSSLSLFNRLR